MQYLDLTRLSRFENGDHHVQKPNVKIPDAEQESLKASRLSQI